MCDFQCSSYVLNFQIQSLFGPRELDNLRIEKKDMIGMSYDMDQHLQTR